MTPARWMLPLLLTAALIGGCGNKTVNIHYDEAIIALKTMYPAAPPPADDDPTAAPEDYFNFVEHRADQATFTVVIFRGTELLQDRTRIEAKRLDDNRTRIGVTCSREGPFLLMPQRDFGRESRTLDAIEQRMRVVEQNPTAPTGDAGTAGDSTLD